MPAKAGKKDGSKSVEQGSKDELILLYNKSKILILLQKEQVLDERGAHAREDGQPVLQRRVAQELTRLGWLRRLSLRRCCSWLRRSGGGSRFGSWSRS